MSNIKVNKVRNGFILRNHQVKKSVPKGTNTAECDGTVIVILEDTIKREEFINLYKNNTQYRYYFTKDGINNFDKINIEEVRALKFEKNYNELEDKVFLDHSVLKLSFDKLTNVPNAEKLGDLIVLNLGSMMNAEEKNWNTELISQSALIEKEDENLYNKFKNLFVNYSISSKLPDYDNIDGKKIINLEVEDLEVEDLKSLQLKIKEFATEKNIHDIYEKMKRKASVYGGKKRKKQTKRKRATKRKPTKKRRPTKRR